MILLLMGPQGSGKSTQGKLLAEKLKMHFISTGDVLRMLYRENDPVGIEANKYWGKGELVPDKIVHDVMKEYLSRHPDPKGYIIDGYPRHAVQYKTMMDVFPEPVNALIYLDLKGSVIEKRLQKRWHLEHRQDENQDAIKRRLQIYDTETHPLVERFRKDGYPVIEVDATPAIEVIFADILAGLQDNNIIA